jgi:subtilisin family serine protease
MKDIQRLLTLASLLIFWLPAFFSVNNRLATADSTASLEAKMAPNVRAWVASAQADEKARVIVHLKDQIDPAEIARLGQGRSQRELIRALKARAAASQRGVKARLIWRQAQGKAENIAPFWVFNGLAVSATAEVIQEIAALPEVSQVTPDETDIIPAAPEAYLQPEANLSLIHADALWDMGYFGQGVVVANMDTGVSLSHPDVGGKWRGGSNSWYDPYGQHPNAPTDLNGHGTMTMGVMLGGDAGGTSIGVAPQAQWIAVKIFDDRGRATATAIHLGFQWLLDPDGNPNTSDAPQVVNNSWTFGGPRCNLEFQNDLRALRAAGILPVFAAGNFGPNPSTSPSPANYPEAFAVGAVDNNNVIYQFSSRGPSACGEPSTIYPELVAPGVNIRSSDIYGLYTSATGTSLSAPHVAGALALLLSAFSNLTPDQQASALINGATDLGAPGADNSFGYGRLDVLASYQWLLNSGGAPPTATPTATPTTAPTDLPAPTFTATPTAIPTDTPTSTPTDTPTAAPPSPTPTNASTATPTDAPTATPTDSPASTPTATASPTSTVDGIFADGFESGGVGAWSSEVANGENLSVSQQASLGGMYGLQATITSLAPAYVQDNTPAGESSYHARFWFSPNGVTLPNRQPHDIFRGLDVANRTVFRLQLRYSSGSYQLRLATRLDAGGEAYTAWYPISGAAQAVEIAWQAASSSSASDGSVTLWVGGVQYELRGSLANSVYRLESVQLGPQGLSTGVSGVEYFDQFVSTRLSYIGP